VSEPINERQKACRNKWHLSPGPILACAVCGMTQSQLKENPPTAAVRSVPQAPPQPPGRVEANGHRVQIKHFAGSDPNLVFQDANAWLTKMAGDPRVQVADSLQMYSHNGQLVVAIFYALAL
jgi:hypothetical protein